jgi:hypothetical protein
MAIASYDDLKLYIAAAMFRDDLTDQIPNFISFAENRIFREFRVWRMKDERTVSLTSGVESFNYLSSAREIKSITLTGNNPRVLKYIPLDALREKYAGASSGIPCEYSFQENKIIVAPIPSSDMSLSVVYVLIPSPLADATPSNLVLQYYPEIYIHATMVEAQRFVRNMEQMAVSEQAYRQALDSAHKESRKFLASGKNAARQDFTLRIP